MKIYIKLDSSKECEKAMQVIAKNLDVKIIDNFIEIDVSEFDEEKSVYSSIMDICRDYDCLVCRIIDKINNTKEK